MHVLRARLALLRDPLDRVYGRLDEHAHDLGPEARPLPARSREHLTTAA